MNIEQRHALKQFAAATLFGAFFYAGCRYLNVTEIRGVALGYFFLSWILFHGFLAVLRLNGKH